MTEGRLVLVFDDGYAEDHEEVRPVLASLDAPAVFAVVPTWLGEEGYLTVEELRGLADEGCEVAVHGRRHRYCQDHPLARDVGAGDERLHLDGGHVVPGCDGGIEVGDRLLLTDDEHEETVEVVDSGAGDDAEYVDLAGPASHDFAAEEAVARLPEDLLRDELLGGREALRARGFDPSTVVFPYDAASVRAWRLAREAYDVVANAAVRSLPNPPGTDRTNLRRWYLETSHLPPPALAEYLDAVAEQGGVGVLAGHSAWDTVTGERVRRVIEAARARGIAVTTFADLDGA